jgi:hypothetical protein
MKDKNHLTHFYIHTPFCIEKCSFCQYHNWLDLKEKNILDKYLNYLEEYILFFSDFFKWKLFWGLYFWWWTASIYSEKQLDRLLGLIFNNIKFNWEFYKEFELHPITTTFKKLDILRKYWIDKISFWIQSFNKKTLDNEGRIYCSPDRFSSLVAYAKSIWFKRINADLILWLNKENKDDMLFSLEQMIICKPTTITLYFLQANKETSKIFDWSNKYYINLKNIYNYLFEKLIKKSEYEAEVYGLTIWIWLSLKWIDNSKKIYDSHSNTIESVFSIWFRSYSHIYWEWKYFLKKDFHVRNLNIEFERLWIEDEKDIFLLRFIQSWKICMNFFKFNYQIDFYKKYNKIINFLINNNKIKIIWWSEIIFINLKKNEIYLYWLLFFNLKFILFHSIYIKKNISKIN